MSVPWFACDLSTFHQDLNPLTNYEMLRLNTLRYLHSIIIQMMPRSSCHNKFAILIYVQSFWQCTILTDRRNSPRSSVDWRIDGWSAGALKFIVAFWWVCIQIDTQLENHNIEVVWLVFLFSSRTAKQCSKQKLVDKIPTLVHIWNMIPNQSHINVNVQIYNRARPLKRCGQYNYNCITVAIPSMASWYESALLAQDWSDVDAIVRFSATPAARQGDGSAVRKIHSTILRTLKRETLESQEPFVAVVVVDVGVLQPTPVDVVVVDRMSSDYGVFFCAVVLLSLVTQWQRRDCISYNVQYTYELDGRRRTDVHTKVAIQITAARCDFVCLRNKHIYKIKTDTRLANVAHRSSCGSEHCSCANSTIASANCNGAIRCVERLGRTIKHARFGGYLERMVWP